VILEAATALALVAPARVQVGADEFRYTLSRLSIKAGPAIVQLANFGEDEHDLRLRRAGGTRTYALGKVGPGKVAELEARFLPGRFTLWCSLADHRKRGMSATLVVRR
jgi:plastocyanin